MSFRFEWPEFSGDFIQGAKEQITEALNKGQKPPNIVGDIVVSELYLGTKVGFCIKSNETKIFGDGQKGTRAGAAWN